MSSHLPGTLLNLLRTWSHFILMSTGKSECFHFKYGKTAQRVGETHSRTHSVPVSVLGRIPGPPELHAPALDLYLDHLSPKMSQLPSRIPWILSSPNFCSNATAPELCAETLSWSQTLVLRDPEPNEQILKLSSGAKRSFSFFPPTFYLCRAWYSVSKEKNQSNELSRNYIAKYCSVKGQCVTLFLKMWSPSQSARAALAKCHRLRGSDHRHSFLTISEAEKSKIKVLDDLVPGDSSLAEGCRLAHLPSL